MKPHALIIQTAGTNCDRELAHAFELAGAQASTVHVNQLIDQPGRLADYDLIGFPGGFSYGDDIAAGRILANRLRHRLHGPLWEALQRGVPMIGICNGFQVLVKLGLLPDPTAPQAQDAAEAITLQTATLADNVTGRFMDRWLPIEADPASACIWTRDVTTDGRFDLPVAHGEGRLVAVNDATLQQWRDKGQIALRYAQGHNLNGSVDRIAGVCDPSGLVLGLMPHPERFVHDTHHPHWSRKAALGQRVEPVGLTFFRNAVNHVISRSPATAEA